MKHNPRLHERVAALPGHARLHPLQDPARAQGALRADVASCSARWPRSPGCRTSRCSRPRARTASSRACCSRAPTTRTAASTRTKVLTPDTAHGTNPATVTMAGLEVVKVGTERRRRRRHRGPARQGRRRRRLPDAHQPEHARDLRPEHRGDRRDRARRRARRCTTTARTSTRSWASRARATWASTSCTSTCTRRSPSRTAAAARVPGRSRSPSGSSRTCRVPRVVRARRRTARPDVRPRLRPPEVDRPAARLPGQLRRASCAPTPTSCSLGAEGLQDACETAVLNANYLLRGCASRRRRAPAARLRRSSACTSSCSPARR